MGIQDNVAQQAVAVIYPEFPGRMRKAEVDVESP